MRASRLRPLALRKFGRAAINIIVAQHVQPSQQVKLAGSYLQAHRWYASAAPVSAADVQYGQPVHETHPHLLKAGELTPGITALEYHQRRSRLAASLPEGGVAILVAADTKYKSGAVFYDFHQESNFFYLTGFNEPEAAAVIRKIGRGNSGEYGFYLFLRSKDPKSELWEGARSGQQGALDIFNADETGDISEISNLLNPLINGASTVYADLQEAKTTFTRFFYKRDEQRETLQKLLQDRKVKSLRSLMNDLRIVKSEAEIANMRLCGKISGETITNAMRQSFDTEKSLGAFLDYGFKIGGCDGTAYVPVLAGGQNALSIHYVRNDDVLRDGQMVLVDAGGDLGGYITDITRTWPISGKFSDPQRELYEMILKVQRSSISLCTADSSLSLDKIHKVTEHGLTEGLRKLGFDMTGDALEVLFPHHVGHYIGLDVHDCPGYPRTGPLRTGQCVTVEPGIYVPNDERWPKHFRGMGIRIEDSICVQNESPLILTKEAVKEVDDIEALRK